MNHFKWKKGYELGIIVIDKQHKLFVGILDQLHSAIIESRADSELLGIYRKLETYANAHFRLEEGYFKKFGYDKAKEHINKHRNFRFNILAIKSIMAHDKSMASALLMDYLKDWLIHHVKEVDRQYVRCFKEHGLK